jgi:hypothetical protein
MAIYIRVTAHGENQARKLFPNLFFFLKPAVEGLTSPEKTDGGYELRSRGPASQGLDALDNLVSEPN